MIFPTLALWSSRDPEDAVGRIDRALHDRNHRLSVGISVSDGFTKVHGALVVSQGNGKYLRVRHVVDATAPIPTSLRDACREVAIGKQRNIGQISLLISELAEIQASVVERLKCEAGKYVDRVLAVAICDPGVWDQDFDGKVSYSPFCDATRLAELCGVTVIDGFPARDLAVGGSGNYLEALPFWILFGDRNSRTANQSRTLVSIDQQCLTYSLPPSDGLDSEVPEVRVTETRGLGFLDELLSRSYPRQELTEFDHMVADGLQIPALRERLEKCSREIVSQVQQNSLHSNDHREITKQLVVVAQEFLKQHPSSFSNVIRTGIRWVVDQCLEQMKLSAEGQTPNILVACPAQYEAGLINQFTQLIPDAKVATTRHSGVDQGELQPVVAAVLGLFHIDQMSANVPWLTGANCQRILGKLTPGRPSNWRQLVRIMADFQPAPMKLKDAV